MPNGGMWRKEGKKVQILYTGDDDTLFFLLLLLTFIHLISYSPSTPSTPSIPYLLEVYS
jgi:hypothetical protein